MPEFLNYSSMSDRHILQKIVDMKRDFVYRNNYVLNELIC